MVELVPGTDVFVYPHMIDRVLKLQHCFSKMARQLLTCFYKGKEIIELKSLTRVEPILVDAMIGRLFSINILSQLIEISKLHFEYL